MVPLSLDHIVGQLEALDPSQVLRVDRQSGDLSIVSSGDASQQSGRFETLKRPTADDELTFARRFCQSASDLKVRERLELALASADPMDAFETALYRCRIAHEWFPFRNEQLVGFAKAQLDASGVPYRDDLAGTDVKKA